MAYVTVYAPDGKKVEVASRDRADKLILQDGWTQTPPVQEEKPKRSPRKKKKEDKFDAEEPKRSFKPWTDADDNEPDETDT